LGETCVPGEYVLLRVRNAAGTRRLVCAGALASGIVSSFAGSAAATGVVEMPFACSVGGGQVALRPSAERRYPIVGRHDQIATTICTTFERGGGRCRRLPLHRFVMECGDARVPWLHVVAAVRSRSWRATVQDGRMSVAPGRIPRAGERWKAISLPPGYAPIPDRRIRIAPAGAGSQMPEGPATGPAGRSLDVRAGPEPFTPAPLALLDLGAHRTTPEGEWAAATIARHAPVESAPLPPLDEAPTPAPAGIVPLSLLPGTIETTTSDAPVVGVAVDDAWLLETLEHPVGLATALGVAALLLSLSAAAFRRRAAAAASGPADPAEHSFDLDGAARESSPPPPPPPARAAASASDPGAIAEPPPLPKRTAPPETPDLGPEASLEPDRPGSSAAVAELREATETLIGLVGRVVDLVPDGPVRDLLVADLATVADRLAAPDLAVALADGRLDVVRPIYQQAIADLERTRTLARIEHERALVTPLATALAEPPSTVAEACAFLGINPRAGPAAAKKVVDALRQSWHPDLARDQADREAREARMKQINAAWDLIQGR
jgi:hypothetical protein